MKSILSLICVSLLFCTNLYASVIPGDFCNSEINVDGNYMEVMLAGEECETYGIKQGSIYEVVANTELTGVYKVQSYCSSSMGPHGPVSFCNWETHNIVIPTKTGTFPLLTKSLTTRVDTIIEGISFQFQRKTSFSQENILKKITELKNNYTIDQVEYHIIGYFLQGLRTILK